MKLVKVVSLFLLLSTAGVMSCKKNDLGDPPGATVAQIITGNSNYSLLYRALQRTGYATYTSNMPNLTLFAPNNTAFNNAGITDANIDTYNLDTLKYLIGYHVSGRSVIRSKITASSQIETISNYIFTSNSTSGIFLNAMSVPTTYTAAANGVIYPLTQFLPTPWKTLRQMVDKDTSLTLLAAAIARDTTFTYLSSTSTFYTLLAPVNDAFRLVNIRTTSDINALSIDTLGKILRYHLLSGTHMLTTDFINANRFTNMRDSTLMTNTSPATLYKMYPKGTQTAITMLTTDSVAINGVSHRISKLLIPSQ